MLLSLYYFQVVEVLDDGGIKLRWYGGSRGALKVNQVWKPAYTKENNKSCPFTDIITKQDVIFKGFKKIGETLVIKEGILKALQQYRSGKLS
jgi:hypothetical protein